MGPDRFPVPVQHFHTDRIHWRDSFPDQDTVRAREIYDTHYHHGVCGWVLQLQLFHVWCDRNVSVRRAGIYPYKERIPNSAHAAFLCIGKAFGVQYAQGIYDLRRQPGHFLYKTDHLCADADFPGIYICTRYQGSYKESKIKGLTVLP